jgi:hypothetical protein
VGAVSVLFYLSLAGICFAAVRRRGATWGYALGVTVVIATIPYIAFLGGLVFIDVPLAVYATVAAIYLVDWMDGGARGVLLIAALGAGLMPWAKREGLVLLALLCLAALVVGGIIRQRAWRGVGAALAAAALLAGPWWMFVTLNGGTNTDFAPITIATLKQNTSRLPTIARMVRTELLSANWSYLWPLAALCGLIVGIVNLVAYVRPDAAGQETRMRSEQERKRRAAALLPLMIVLYIGTMSLGYVVSGFVPYQQHIENSFYRLVAHVAPLLVLWMARQGIEVDSSLDTFP